MNRSQSPRPRSMGGLSRLGLLVGLAIVLGLAAGIANILADRSMTFSMATYGLVFAVLIGATIWWWKSADEAAREAHKWAWYWGGSIGMCVALTVLIATSLAAPQHLAIFERLGPAYTLFLGGMFVVILEIMGYIAAWIWWWVSKR